MTFHRTAEERLAAVVEETEARCPVFNLVRPGRRHRHAVPEVVKDAGVDIDMVWIRRAA